MESVVPVGRDDDGWPLVTVLADGNKLKKIRALPRVLPFRNRYDVSSLLLPHELMLNILSRIPVASLVRFRCVCKSWYNLLTDDPHFIRMHLERSLLTRRSYSSLFGLGGSVYQLPLLDHNSRGLPASKLDTSFVLKKSASAETNYHNYLSLIHSASCNGLFLICQYDVLYLWNPATREHRQLPIEVPQFPTRSLASGIHLFGLGYDSTNNEYKVVSGLFRPCRVPNLVHCFEYSYSHVYTLKTNTVRMTQGLPLVVQKSSCTDTGISLHDSILWLFLLSTGMFQIVSFHVWRLEYKQVPMPDVIMTNTSAVIRHPGIGVLEGCLCLYYLDPDMTMNVIKMKEYGVRESWTKLFSIQYPRSQCSYFTALFFDNTEEVMIQMFPFPSLSHLVVCKPKETGRIMIVAIQDLPALGLLHSFKIKPYVESLVHLESTRPFDLP